MWPKSDDAEIRGLMRPKQATSHFNDIHENSGDRYGQTALHKGLITQSCLSPVHNPQICPNPQQVVNDIHSLMMTFTTHLTWVTVSEGVDRSLRLNLSFSCQHEQASH